MKKLLENMDRINSELTLTESTDDTELVSLEESLLKEYTKWFPDDNHEIAEASTEFQAGLDMNRGAEGDAQDPRNVSFKDIAQWVWKRISNGEIVRSFGQEKPNRPTPPQFELVKESAENVQKFLDEAKSENRELWDRINQKGVVRGIDRERWTERKGLEGPFQTKSGAVRYYDPKEGKYYDPTTDMYTDGNLDEGIWDDIKRQPGEKMSDVAKEFLPNPKDTWSTVKKGAKKLGKMVTDPVGAADDAYKNEGKVKSTNDGDADALRKALRMKYYDDEPKPISDQGNEVIPEKMLASNTTKTSEAKNHLGEKEYQTYSSWRVACRKTDPDVWFDGDRDIAQAFVGPNPYIRGESKSIGEWDGAVGSVFNPGLSESSLWAGSKCPFEVGDKVLVDGYQGLGYIHSFSMGKARVLFYDHNARAEVDLSKLHLKNKPVQESDQKKPISKKWANERLKGCKCPTPAQKNKKCPIHGVIEESAKVPPDHPMHSKKTMPKLLKQIKKNSTITEKSVSQKQARTMAAAAHDPKFAKKVGIKQDVAKEFNKADAGTKQLSNAMKTNEGKLTAAVKLVKKTTNESTQTNKYSQKDVERDMDELKSKATPEATVMEIFADQGAGHAIDRDEPYHRVLVVVTDPNATNVSQRSEEIQKHIRLKGDAADAVERAEKHYRKKGYKIVDSEYLGEYNTDDQLVEYGSATAPGANSTPTAKTPMQQAKPQAAVALPDKVAAAPATNAPQAKATAQKIQTTAVQPQEEPGEELVDKLAKIGKNPGLQNQLKTFLDKVK